MRTAIAILVAIGIGVTAVWVYQTRLAPAGTELRSGAQVLKNIASRAQSGAGSSSRLSTWSGDNVSGKFLCDGAVTYDLRSDGTFHSMSGASSAGVTTSGTYAIKSDRITFDVKSKPSQVYYFRDGMLSITGSGHDCLKASSHAGISSGGGRYSCGNGAGIFEFTPSDVVYAYAHGGKTEARYEIYGGKVFITVDGGGPAILTYRNGVLGEQGLKDCVKLSSPGG